MTQAAPTILLVEDNPGDVRLTREALTERGLPHRLRVATGVDAAAELLREQRPELVLLDLNLPGKPGIELLREIKRDPALRAIRVAVFSSSDAAADVHEAESLSADCYITKPRNFDAFANAIELLCRGAKPAEGAAGE